MVVGERKPILIRDVSLYQNVWILLSMTILEPVEIVLLYFLAHHTSTGNRIERGAHPEIDFKIFDVKCVFGNDHHLFPHSVILRSTKAVALSTHCKRRSRVEAVHLLEIPLHWPEGTTCVQVCAHKKCFGDWARPRIQFHVKSLIKILT